jgi:hypothetical protein
MAEEASFPLSLPLEIASPPKQYALAGYCIYCRNVDVKLELEHILPFGIAGDSLLFPQASCRRCAKITGKVEQAVLRHMWWPFRTHIGAPTSKPKDRPDDFTLRRVVRTAAGEFVPTVTSQVPAKDYPMHLMALKLRAPGILEGRPTTGDLEGEIWVRFGHKADQSLSETLGLADQEGILALFIRRS